MPTPRTCLSAAAALLLALLTAPLQADQHAPELDTLFAALTASGTAEEAASIEQQIWTHWMVGPTAAADELLAQARSAADAGQTDAAVDAFDKLSAQFPDYAEGWNQRAIMHYLLGDIQGSLTAIERVLTLEPRHFGAYAGRGQCYLRLERPRESLAAFEASLRINPWSATVQQQIEVLRSYVQEKLTPI